MKQIHPFLHYAAYRKFRLTHSGITFFTFLSISHEKTGSKINYPNNCMYICEKLITQWRNVRHTT